MRLFPSLWWSLAQLGSCVTGSSNKYFVSIDFTLLHNSTALSFLGFYSFYLLITGGGFTKLQVGVYTSLPSLRKPLFIADSMLQGRGVPSSAGQRLKVLSQLRTFLTCLYISKLRKELLQSSNSDEFESFFFFFLLQLALSFCLVLPMSFRGHSGREESHKCELSAVQFLCVTKWCCLFLFSNLQAFVVFKGGFYPKGNYSLIRLIWVLIEGKLLFRVSTDRCDSVAVLTCAK